MCWSPGPRPTRDPRVPWKANDFRAGVSASASHFSADLSDCLCFPVMRSRRGVAREDGACWRRGDAAMTLGLLRRLLKKFHLRRWPAGYPSGRWVRRCAVRAKYASRQVLILMGAHPADGYPARRLAVRRVHGPERGRGTSGPFLSSLGEDEFFSILLGERSVCRGMDRRGPQRCQGTCR